MRLVNTQVSTYSILGPKSVTMSLANVCNTDCVFCPLFSDYSLWERSDSKLSKLPAGAAQSEEAKKRTPFTDFESLRVLADDLRRMKVEEIFFAGAGEPIAHPRIEDICELFGASHQVVVITNGIGLNKLKREKLLKHRVYLRLSLHAATEATWKAIHPINDIKHFARITQAVKEIQSEYGDRVVIHNVITRANFRECFAMLELARSIGVKEVSYLPVITKDLKNRELFDLGAEEKAFLLKELTRVSATAASWGMKTNADHYRRIVAGELEEPNFFENGATFRHDASNLYKKIQCNIGYAMATITPDQDVRPCCQCKPLGSFKGSSFKEFWNSDVYRQFRERGKNITETGGIDGCDCSSCQNFAPNIKIHNTLHPLNKV